MANSIINASILIQIVILLCVHTSAFHGTLSRYAPGRKSNSFLLHQESPKSTSAFENLSRRDVIFIVGGSAYGKLVLDSVSRMALGNHYPPKHEEKVSTTLEKTITVAANRQIGQRSLRVLEVGIGSTWRTVTNGLYDKALENVSSQATSSTRSLYPITGIDIVGADIDIPKPDVLMKANDKLSKFDLSISLEAIEGDITKKLPFSDGYFDAITCSLVLCSVSNQYTALNEIKRLLNPTGGVFGYVEHVAVQLDNEDEKRKRSFLEWQQRVLDPVQQAVADNCHLHRKTDTDILNVFSITEASTQILNRERFFVTDMWPVSCQCCGVITLNDSKI